MSASIVLTGAPSEDRVPGDWFGLRLGPYEIAVGCLATIELREVEALLLRLLALAFLRDETRCGALASRILYRGGRKARSAERRLAGRARRIGPRLRATITSFAREIVTSQTYMRVATERFMPDTTTDGDLLEPWGDR